MNKNPKLVELYGLENLTAVEGDLIIDDNAALHDLSALYGVRSIGGQLYVFNNTQVTPAEAQALEDAIGEGVVGQVTIRGY